MSYRRETSPAELGGVEQETEAIGDLGSPSNSGTAKRAESVRNARAARAQSQISGAGGGQALGEELRSKLEHTVGGADLSAVRLHSGSESADAARTLGASAFAVGQDIHFGSGKLDAGSSDGQRLIAHEVAHTVQQQGASSPSVQTKLEIGTAGDSYESEADRVADAHMKGDVADISVGQVSSPRIACFEDEEEDPWWGDGNDSFLPGEKEEYLYLMLNNGDSSELEAKLIRQELVRREALSQGHTFTFEEFDQIATFADWNWANIFTRKDCITAVNHTIKKLYGKGQRTGFEMDKTMALLQKTDHAGTRHAFEFVTEEGKRTTGVNAPHKLEKSVAESMIAEADGVSGYHIFGLSIMDAYHSVQIALNLTDPGDPVFHWIDQVLGEEEMMPEELDGRIEELTVRYWNRELDKKKVKMRTHSHFWKYKPPLTEDRPGAKEFAQR